VAERLNPHPRLRRECGTLKIKGVGSGDSEGSATRPQRELDGLVAKETDDRRIILPVWHNVSLRDVREHSITLADRVAANSADGIQTVVKKLLLAISGSG
jgi:hypothetical protein